MKLKALTLSILLASSVTMSHAATNYEIRLPTGAGSMSSQVTSDTLLALSATTLAAAQNEAYNYDFASLLTITGTNPPLIDDIVWTVADTLPAGLSLTGSVLSGSPTDAGDSTFTLIATDTNDNTQQSYTLTVSDVALSLASSSLSDAQQNQAYSYDFASLLTISGTVNPPAANDIIWSVIDTLPSGMSLTGSVLSGTPTGGGATSFTLMASSNSLQSQQTYTLTISDIALSLASASIIDAGLNTPFSYDFAPLLSISGTNAPSPGAISWSVSGTLPSGLSLSGSVLTGTPLNTTTGNFTISAVGAGITEQQSYSLNVDGTYLKGVTEVRSAYNHACAIAGGALYCWGNNSYNQLGDGTATQRTKPTLVSGLTSGVTAIATGQRHTCAVHNGAAKCWGYNGFGQVGDGSSSQRATPVAVTGLSSGVSDMSAGRYHSCAIHNGGAKCWGYGTKGQIGNGTANHVSTPAAVTGMTSNVSSITAGHYHSCAIQNGAAKCWGYNSRGQLGDNSATQKNTPVSVYGLTSGVTVLDGGVYSTCAIHNGTAKCWGYNSSSQLGDGSSSDRAIPVSVAGMPSGVTDIDISNAHACAIASGAPYCWGSNSQNQLGNTSYTSYSSALAVTGSPAAVKLNVGNYSSYIITPEGGIKSWGYNAYGDLGDNTITTRGAPVNVVKP